MKHRYWKYFCILAVLLAALLGCTACHMEDTSMSNTPTWTDNERALLEHARVDEDRLASGKLLAGERRMLEALHAAEAFLAERYPAEKMSFYTVNNIGPAAQSYRFTVATDATAVQAFAVKVTPGANGEPAEVLESRYCDMKAGELTELVAGVLAELGVDGVCRPVLIGMYGAAHDPSVPLSELAQHGLLVDVSGEIYVSAGYDAVPLAASLSTALRARGLCGGLTLISVLDATPAEAAALPLLENPYINSKMAIRLIADESAEVE